MRPMVAPKCNRMSGWGCSPGPAPPKAAVESYCEVQAKLLTWCPSGAVDNPAKALMPEQAVDCGMSHVCCSAVLVVCCRPSRQAGDAGGGRTGTRGHAAASHANKGLRKVPYRSQGMGMGMDDAPGH